MASYELTEKAEAHVAEIYLHSIREFGKRTARRYLEGLHAVFALLATSPKVGTEIAWIRAGYRRLAHESHVVYYREGGPGIVIVGVLHRSQDPARHFAS